MQFALSLLASYSAESGSGRSVLSPYTDLGCFRRLQLPWSRLNEFHSMVVGFRTIDVEFRVG